MIAHNLGALASVRGDLEGALDHYLRGAEVLGRSGDQVQMLYLLNDLGMLYRNRRCFDEAEETLGRALGLAREVGNTLVEGVVEMNRGELYLETGRLEDAEACCFRSLEIATSRSDPLRRAEALRVLGMIDRDRGRPSAAETALNEAYTLALTSRDALLCAEILREEGELWNGSGDADRARRIWSRAVEAFTDIGARMDAEDLQSRIALLAA
jgi:tetratricopeptide (TPR) repeat protein